MKDGFMELTKASELSLKTDSVPHKPTNYQELDSGHQTSGWGLQQFGFRGG